LGVISRSIDTCDHQFGEYALGLKDKTATENLERRATHHNPSPFHEPHSLSVFSNFFVSVTHLGDEHVDQDDGDHAQEKHDQHELDIPA
jgi:hypothetical protein